MHTQQEELFILTKSGSSESAELRNRGCCCRCCCTRSIERSSRATFRSSISGATSLRDSVNVGLLDGVVPARRLNEMVLHLAVPDTDKNKGEARQAGQARTGGCGEQPEPLSL